MHASLQMAPLNPQLLQSLLIFRLWPEHDVAEGVSGFETRG